MASFVREILSAAGTLGEKEDFAAKTTKIQKKLNDLKSQLSVHITNRYGNFSTTLSNTTNLTTQMERLAGEVEAMDATINKHFRAELVDRNKELIELNESMQELNLTLQIVTKIKRCYDLMERSNEGLSSGKWLTASQSLQAVFILLREPCSEIDESSIKIFPAIKTEIVSQKRKFSSKLAEEWNRSVSVSVREDNKKKLVTNSIILSSSGTNDKFIDVVADLVRALHDTETLEDVVYPFTQHLKKEFLKTILSGKTSIDIPSNSFSVIIDSKKEKSDPFKVFKSLRLFFSFLLTNLSVPLSQEENSPTFLQLLGSSLSTWFCQAVIEDVLAPAVPSSVDKLPAYEDILNETEAFHDFVVETGFLPSSNLILLNYARNVDVLFANKTCQELLVKAREIMKEDLFTTVLVEPGDIINPDPLNQKPDYDDLPIPPNFSMPEKTFQFPSCQVSCSTLKVLELARKGLDEAVAAKAFCSVRLFNTVRNIFELWCAVVPTFHKSNLESLPQLSAIAHNSAMYLAHKLVTLGFLYKEKLSALAKHTPTFIDIVPRLRTVGGEIMLQSMRIQRDSIISTLSNAGMTSAGSERRLSSGVDQAVRQFLHLLAHLQKVWQPVLPSDIYHRCIGSLVNSGVEEIVQKILSLSDISSEVSEQYCSLLNQIVLKTPGFFAPETPEKFAKKWSKFLELIVVLNSSLRVIEDRWGEGKGVLAAEFSPEEVKQLIRAIFQNTERRAAVLSKIK